MSLSTDLWRSFGVLLLMIVGTVGCAQFGGENAALPTAPSSLSAGPSTSLTQSSVFTPMGHHNAVPYDADGSWHLVVTDLRSGEVYDDVDTELTQDDNDGTITFCGECEGELFTLTPLGTAQGTTVPYELSYFGEGSPCDASASGTVLLNTITNTIRGQGQGTTDDCSSVFLSLTLTRN